MTNTLKITIGASFLVLSLFQSSLGQQVSGPSSVAAAEEQSTREQDGLQGPVRRVRVETAKVLMKGDKAVEGPRLVRGIATYDALGKKIDAVDYPLESTTVSGKEKYRYDDKGNIVEMVVIGSDGSILGKEAYTYELDPMGNWTKMNTAVAIYENGKVTFEPTEVTYRTISYYYNQAIEKLNTAAKSKSASGPSISTPASTAPSQVKPVAMPRATNQTVAEKVAATENSGTKTTPIPLAQNNDSAGTKTTPVNESNAAAANHAKPDVNKVEETTPVKDANVAAANVAKPDVIKVEETTPVKEANVAAANVAKPDVIKVEESVLRSAAIDLPEPEYPQTALMSRVKGPVEVQLLVNEKGLVTNARAQSGSPFLMQAAEAAALKARFAPAKLSANPSITFGVITYNFILPKGPSPTLASNTISESTPRTADQKVAPNQSAEKNALAVNRPATFTETKPNLAAEASHYNRGVKFLTAGHYEEASLEFNQALQANPNDANTYLRLALSYSGLKKDKEALGAYKMAKQIEPSVFDASAYFSWGRSYLALEKNSEAISAFKQTISLMRAEAIGLESKTSASMPAPEQVHHHLGVAYINARRFNDAIKEFKQVVELNPANAEAHYALAISYLNTGDQRAAQDESKILTSLDPEMAKKLAVALGDTNYGCRNVACRR